MREDIGTDRIVRAEFELETVGLVFVQRVVVEDLDVHEPFVEAFCLHQDYAGR